MWILCVLGGDSVLVDAIYFNTDSSVFSPITGKFRSYHQSLKLEDMILCP